MNIEFTRELDGSYLLLDGNGSGPVFEQKMLLYGKPAGFLPFRVHQEKDGLRYSYEISGKQSLLSLTRTGEMDETMMREILLGIYRNCSEAELYLLRPAGIMLDPGLIFKGNGNWSFVYCPDEDRDIYEQLQALSRFFLRKCSHEDEKTARIAYELFSVCHEENNSFSQIFSIWEKEEALQRPGKEEKKKGGERGLFFRKGRKAP